MIPHETVFMDWFGNLYVYCRSYVWGIHRLHVLQSNICYECGHEHYLDIADGDLKKMKNLGVL